LLLALSGAFLSLVIGDSRRLLMAAAFAVQVGIVTAAGAAWLGTSAGGVLVHFIGDWAAPLGIVLVLDSFSAIVLLLVVAVFFAALFYFFAEEETASLSRGLALFFLLQAGVSGALATGDLFDFFVFFELMSLSSYAAVAYRYKRLQIEASLKYAALSLFGSTLLLMGIGVVYAQTGVLTLAALAAASETIAFRQLHLFAVGLILVALSLKTALVPLHFWLPDAHSMAPTAISVVLSGALVNVGAYGILRILTSNPAWVWDTVRGTLVIAGAVTAAFAALLSVGQRDLKRMLAYSTASQMGYVVTAAALGTVAGVAAGLVSAIAHALAKATLFVIAGVLIDATGQRQWKRMHGMAELSPWLATAMLACGLSLAGIPPLPGFVAKVALFSAVIEARAWWSLAALIVASMCMLYLMGRIFLGIFGGAPPAERKSATPNRGKVALAIVMTLILASVGLLSGPVVLEAGAAARDLLDGEAYRRAVLGRSTEVGWP
jgi:multicomponent Na+:H+ antiporter subunit D